MRPSWSLWAKYTHTPHTVYLRKAGGQKSPSKLAPIASITCNRDTRKEKKEKKVLKKQVSERATVSDHRDITSFTFIELITTYKI